MTEQVVPVYRLGDGFADHQPHARLMAVLEVARARKKPISLDAMQGIFKEFGTCSPLSIDEPGATTVSGAVIQDLMTDLERQGVVVRGPSGTVVGPHFDEVTEGWGREFRDLVDAARKELDMLHVYSVWGRYVGD